jgi:CIC family chloride channel protein
VIAGNQVTARKTWRSRLQSFADAEKLHQYEDQVLLVLTLIIGAVVGLVIAGFIYLTENLGSRMYPPGSAAWRRLVIPTAGSLITGYLLSRYFPGARGSGIPQTKAALFLRDGFISLRTVVGKFFLSSTSLASGIALGREGPSVQIGAGLASVLGRRLGLGSQNIRQLVPIGSAAALAAAFNTPVAAVQFTLEEVMGDLHAPVLGSIVLSSATSWIVLHLLLGDEPLFHVPAYQLVSPIEFVSYGVLGIVGGIVSVCFVKLLLFIRKRFTALPRWTDWLQPAAGGLLVGLMGWFVPEVLGVGYGHVSEALNGQMALTTMALLVVLKLIATAACYGPGNAGGIFGPSLFIGAMLGGAVGSAAHQFFPDYTGSVGAYALVGMGAAFAGIVRVPLASVIMIFEMTRDYSIIVPLMISNLMSFYISYRLQKEPIYEALAHQDGLHLPSGLKDRQGMLTVRQAMTTADHRLSKFDRLRDALACFSEDRDACPVLTSPSTDHAELLGMVSKAEIETAIDRGGGDRTLAEVFPNYEESPGPPESLRAESFPHVHVDHPLDVALRRMAQSKLNVLPVVSRSNVRELRGVVSLQGVLRAYGVVQEPAVHQKPIEAQARTSWKFVPGMIAALLVLVFVIGFLRYSYRFRRGELAEQYFKGGSEQLLQGRNEEAVEQFRNALSISPANQQYRLSLGLTLSKTGHPNEAAVYLDEVLKRDPDNGAANLGLARIASSRGKASDAITYYHRAIYGTWPAGEEKSRLDARFELADYLRKASQQKEAIAELLAALEQSRNDDAAKKRIGRLLLEYGSPRQAADVFHDILHTNSRDAQSWASLGMAELAQEDYQTARNAFRNVVRLDPSDEQSRRRLELVERILALDPNATGLRVSARYEKSTEILSGALKMEEQCLAVAKADADASLADAARKELAHRARRGETGEATDMNLDLAVRLWKTTKSLCPSGQQKDEALDRVLARLSRQ